MSIIILNWNRRDDTLECLRSVQRIDYPDFETIVVDNGSSDGSVAAMRTAFPQVRVLEAKENLGYAGGNNVGIRDALERGTDYVLLLNNDTIVDPALLREFVDAAAAALHIAVRGEQHRAAFFPLYPLLVRSVGELGGGSPVLRAAA